MLSVDIFVVLVRKRKITIEPDHEYVTVLGKLRTDNHRLPVSQ